MWFPKGTFHLTTVTDFFNSLINNPTQSDVVNLNFRKAFDSAAYNELLCKLWHFGITGSLWEWFRAYLSDRTQYVAVGQSVSSTLPVISGVPQGSILGPLLFLIFINDLPDFISSSLVLLLADDAKCLMPISTTADCLSLQSDINSVADWSSTWNLIFNEDKCTVIRFNRGQSWMILTYSINNKIISCDDTHKDLGVIMSSDLHWRSHYQFIIPKAYMMLGLLRQGFSSVKCVSVKHLLYLSFVRSKLL